MVYVIYTSKIYACIYVYAIHDSLNIFVLLEILFLGKCLLCYSFISISKIRIHFYFACRKLKISLIKNLTHSVPNVITFSSTFHHHITNKMKLAVCKVLEILKQKLGRYFVFIFFFVVLSQIYRLSIFWKFHIRDT